MFLYRFPIRSAVEATPKLTTDGYGSAGISKVFGLRRDRYYGERFIRTFELE